MNSCLKNVDLKDIDEKFWKTVEYERQLFEARKSKDPKPSNPNK